MGFVGFLLFVVVLLLVLVVRARLPILIQFLTRLIHSHQNESTGIFYALIRTTGEPLAVFAQAGEKKLRGVKNLLFRALLRMGLKNKM